MAATCDQGSGEVVENYRENKKILGIEKNYLVPLLTEKNK